ncbi:ribosome silencing factor [Bacillus carboniphilus]|uniref:Ribosomal silencing factor RsfS n=1 Tax=Bacillus carboniphilus TaxID=86663 RepID=A0ABY9K267_9BACI|nr:ribosome silencing factor [Bacillus carboniphilus]WLR44011.1 ribosome silencing factor [Bacillus carboniphilus]
MTSKDILSVVVKAADQKKAEEMLSLNVKNISLVADYFFICHGNNHKQVQAIAKEIKEVAQENGIEVKRLEGYHEARWILIDLGEVIAHIFYHEERSYYNLEKLWGDAPIETVLSERP